MRAAQIGLGEGGQDRAILLAAGEIDVANQPAEQPRRIDMGAPIADALEREAGQRERASGLLGLLHGAVEVAPECSRVVKSGSRIDDAFGVE